MKIEPRNPIERQNHGGDFARGLAMEGDKEWKQLQIDGKIHTDDCLNLGGTNPNCPRCLREAIQNE